MKTIATVLLSLLIMCGSAMAKKYEILLRYENGNISQVENNCTSKKGRLMSTKRIVDGEAVVREVGNNPNVKKGKLRLLSNGVTVNEIEISFDHMQRITEQMVDGELFGRSDPVENKVFVAELPFDESVDAIEIVSGDKRTRSASTNIIPISEFVDDSGRGMQFQEDPCDLRIVILPEWYSIDEAGAQRFRTEAANIAEHILETPPYSEFANKIKFYWPFYPDQMTTQDTVIEPSGDYYPFESTCVNCHAREMNEHWDELYVLINDDDRHAGAADWECAYPDTPISASRDTFSWGTNNQGTYRFIGLHEISHSGPGLRDEYVYEVNDVPLFNPYPNPCSEDNCCENCDIVLDADCNNDHKVDLFDVKILTEEYGRSNCYYVPCDADCNDDGRVSAPDIYVMRQEFGETSCGWDLEPGCEGCQKGCTWLNYYRCGQVACVMHQVSGVNFCNRCTDMIRTHLQQCFNHH